jgi:predicted RNA-binding Zn ribbon-like protein
MVIFNQERAVVTAESKVESSITDRSAFVCLDFANTVGDYQDDERGDKLGSYAALVAWAQEEELLSEEEGRRLLGEASKRAAEAKAVLKDAKRLRRTIFNIFSATAQGRAPSGEDMAILNTEFVRIMPYQKISQEDGGFVLDWQDQPEELGRPLWTVVRCTSNLLTSNELGRVSECNSGTCTWLFIDQSKNASRKWCDMGTCGNRAKSRRHYARTHQSAAAEG